MARLTGLHGYLESRNGSHEIFIALASAMMQDMKHIKEYLRNGKMMTGYWIVCIMLLFIVQGGKTG